MIKLSLKMRLALTGIMLVGAAVVYAMEFSGWHNLEAVTLDADPNAVPFYERMGCRGIGRSHSGSIGGRMLPRLRKAMS